MHPYFTRISLLLLCCLTIASTYASAERYETDLSSHEWNLWRDNDAEWVDDPLFLPPVNLDNVPENPPTCGWDRLPSMTELSTALPATVEQFFWVENGNDDGTAGDWRGVSWWTTTVDIPAACAGQRLFLDFDSVHLRAEVYVNRVLTGYDIIGHTPFSIDITGTARAGERNEIAVRITDPLGNFSWNDRTALQWGNRDIPAAHGFGGITGSGRRGRAGSPAARMARTAPWYQTEAVTKPKL